MAKFLENKASIQKQVKPKKKKKEETVVKKAQSPSVSNKTQQTVSRLNQKYGGGSAKPQTVKKPNAGAKKSAQPVTQQTRQKTVDRLSTKYGQNKVERQEPKRRFQPETTERISKNPRMLDTASNINPDRDPQNAANRAARNTPTIAKESLKQVAAGHGKTAADITSMNQSSNIGAKIDIKSKEFQEDIQRRRVKSTEAANKAYDEISKIQDKSEQKMQKLTKDAKGLEKAYYGALESGIGMATDQLLGPAWAVSMMSRTYGNTRGKAQQEGATENEDRANALLQGAKEVATEYLFRGVGLASKLSGAKSLSPSERIAKAATKNMTGTAANVTHAGIRLLGGTAEENIEELIGWGLDPLISEAAYKRNVRTREAQQMLKDQSDSLRSNITSEEDARSIAAYLGSDDFIESNMKTYMDSGIGEAEARELAEKMRDYLTASLTGDTEAMADIEEELSKTLSGKGLSKESWSLSELMDTVASTTLLTMATGLPGSMSTAARGAAFLENNSNERIRALADTAIDFENKEMSAKAEAMRDRLDAGQELTSTQAYDLMQGVAQQYAKDSDRQQAAYRVADNTIRDDKLVAPFEVTRNGNLRMGEVTNKEYRSNTREAKKSITGFIKSDSSESITEEQIDRGSRAIAGFKTGVFTVDDANELNYRNTAVRDAFKAETGIDLNEHIVKDKNGEVDIPATNTATKNALFALAAENLVVSAQAETENWMDNTKGEVVAQISNRMGAQGLVDLQYVLDDVDERDRATYMMTANMADVMYQQGRNLGLEWDAVKADAKRLAPGIPQEKLREMYEAGRFDRDRAEDKARGQQIKVGEKVALAKDNEAPMGQVLMDTDKPVKGTVIRAFSEVAKNLGVDIHLVDHFTDKDGNVLKNVNGEYINGAIYINVNSKFEKNIGYIFMHEVTHHLKTFAPEQYNELENLVRERWFKYDSAQMQNEIAKKIEAYERNGQTLTEEQALEEIIADAAHEFLNDRNFANAVAEENPTLAQAVLNSIRNALRMLRRVLATGSIDDETHMNTLFSQLDILDEAERLWLGAYTQAVKNKAAVDLNRLQDRIYEEGRQSITANPAKPASYSVSDMPSIDQLDQTNSIVEDENGDMVAQFQENGSVQFSISSFENSGRQIYEGYLKKQVANHNLSKAEADEMLRELDTIYKVSKEFADKTDEDGNPVYAPYTAWSYADVVTDDKGKPVFSAIKKNSEYKMNIDFSTICKKRRTLDAVFREMINRGMFEKLDLNKDESAAMVVNINNLIRQHKFEAACALCFVEARRYRQQQTATTFKNMWNNLVESMYTGNNKADYFNFGEDSTVKPVKNAIHTLDDSELDLTYIKKIANEKDENGKKKQTAEAKAARLLLNDPSQRKLMRVGDMMASTGFENMQIQNPELMKVYNSKKETGGAKSSFGDVQYLNEILKPRSFGRMSAYAVSGVRIQSFSDYVPRMVFDYVQVIADLAAKRLPAHGYTKEPLFVKQFGLTGTKINMSLVPNVVADGVAPGLDANGNYIWNEEGTFPYDEAMAIQKAEGYKENCGTIAVGISDEHIRKMLADPEIQMVIPYHKSSLNPIVAAMTNVDRFKDYTEFQNTKDAEGKTVAKDFEWDKKLFRLSHDAKGKMLPKEQWGDVQDLVKEYAEWCEKHNYTPKFAEFLYMDDGSINPGYYKLLEDFALLDNDGNFKPQGDVQMRFPTDSDAFGSMKDLIAQGLSEDAELEAKRSAEIGTIVDEIGEMFNQGTLTEQSAASEKLSARLSISADLDEPYMSAVNSGNMEEAQRLVNEAAKKAMPNTKLKGRWYHGTENEFTEFNFSQGGKNGTADGFGIYLTNDPEVASSYGNRMIEGYVNVTRPASALTSQTLTKSELRRLIKRTVEDEALQMAEDYDSNIEEAKFDTWISNYTDTRYAGNIDKAIDEVIKGITSYNGNDMDIIQEIMVGMGIRNYEDATRFYDILTETTGVDGFETKWGDESEMADPNTPTIALAFRSSQIKSADTITYAEDGSVIPLSERFDPSNDDIRYSMSTTDSDGNLLTDGQMEYFKNSQARDEKGRLIPMYHVTPVGGFTIFDPAYSSDQRSISFTNDMDFALNYSSEDEDIDAYRTAYETRLGDGETTGIGHYKTYLNMQNPYIVDGSGIVFNDEVAELTAYAQSEGYDGLIMRNFQDLDADIYQVFSSNQVKDTRNTDPTENPDIRFSFTEDEVNSRKDYDYASSDSYEMLEMYEDMLSDEDMLNEFVDASDEKYYTDYFMSMLEKYGKSDKRARKTGKTAHIKLDNTAEAIDAFYASLTPETRMVYDDDMLEEGRKRMATSKQDFWNHLNAKWNDRWISGGEVLKVESVKKDVMNLVMGIMDQTTSGKRYKSDVVKKTLIDMRLAYQFMKQGRSDAASALLYHSALRMIENVDFIEDDTEYQNYKGLRDYLRNTRIHFSEEYWNDVGFQEYRKRNMSRIKIVKGPNDIDKGIYSELQRQWPEYFSEEEMRKNGYKMNVPGMMSQLDYVLNLQVDPVTYAYSSEECAEWAFTIADDLYTIMEKGVAVNSLADQYEARNEANIAAEREKADKRVANEKAKAEKDIAAEKAKTEKAVLTAKGYKEKFDEEARAMKTRHAEALLRIRKAKEEGIAAEKAHFKEYKEQQREQKYHTKYFDSIADSHKKLTERLTTNTKDKHIPEQYKKQLAKLLAAFDLQTVGSKKLEIKKGLYYRQNYKSQKTIKMQAIKNALINIEANSPLFEINDSITDIIDRLLGKNEKGEYKDELSIEGKTIDALSASELKDIDKLLKALIHEFNYYESVRVGIKRQQAADIGSEQIKICLNHVEKQGEGKDWQDFLGHMDNILSLDEVTPAYMFRMIDRESRGLGLMFKELRSSFNRYVENQKQLNEWMEDILGEYHNKGKAWNKYGSDQIEEWRIARSAQEFHLESGKTISLTPAQMMSIYCLSNRQQAYDHMTDDGIVVQPVTFMARMETDLKRKTNPAIPAQLTQTDIDNIKSQLTPDQIKVATKLQELMATKMAEWGNEASMNVLGIRLFEDPDYFPIKSDKAALEKDFSPQQFIESVRNFGFTKAVQPKASNSIAVNDIFDVVAEHCNQMNLYNAYTESMNDFMKVYNYKEYQETETGYTNYSVEQAVAYAFSKKATTYIGTFMKDLNGNVSKERMTGIEGLTNDLLGKAKKTSVFANGRVALQQPTAFVRAFAVIDPKYIKGVSVTNATMREMFEHSPIALWKSWGFYDINMGKSVEDLMMNNGNWLEDWMTDLYGKLDNRTWAAIWGMCKAEIEDKHKDVKAGTDEYWELVSGRFDEVIDLTQVVDSPFHRSHAMRSKSIFTKMFTAFMAEPTLTFNMVRDGLIHAREQSKLGNKAEAGKIRARAIGTFIASAVFTSAAAAIWDAVRGKDPESWLGKLLGADDDDDKNVFEKWWVNFLNNVQDNLNLFNNIYYVKDIMSYFQGWEQRPLYTQGFKHFSDMKKQLCGERVSSNLSWWQNLVAGVGYLTGLPLKTVMNDFNKVWKGGFGLFGITAPEPFLPALEQLDSIGESVKDMNRGESSTATSTTGESSSAKKKFSSASSTTSVNLWTYDNAPFRITDGSLADNFLNHFGINLTAAELKSMERAEARKKMQKEVDDIKEKTANLTGEAKSKKVWSYVTTFHKEQNGDKALSDFIEAGDFDEIENLRSMYVRCGGDTDYFEERIYAGAKKALKKSIIGDPTAEQIETQWNIKNYLTGHGMSASEMSEIAYKSDTARDLKVAFRINDENAIIDELVPLIRAGLTREDYERLYKNRNRLNLKTYDGKYKDRLKSTGTYNWPINGQITSGFGHRSSPGGIGSTNHQGLDIAGNMGDPVAAADGGVVVMAGWYGGAGKTVQIQHDDGTITQYSHLSWWDCKVGDTVAQGQTIGNVGSTGNSTGPHLHFGVKVNGSYVNPLDYLN